MKRILFVLVLLVAATVAVGFYMGWFTMTTGTADGKTNVNVTVDKDKIKADEQRAKDKAKEIGEKAKDKAGAAVDKVK
jgi:uncharacterized protein YxeA